MSRTPRPPRAKHRGSIRTKLRVLYLVAAFNAALADPALVKHVALLGNLFTRRRGKAVTSQQLVNALAARHPETGQPLRARVNTGTRAEGDRRVSNVCHGFDIPFAVDKTVSVAALMLGDKFVLKASMAAMQQSARWLGKRMDRRLRKNRQNATVPTGASAIFFLPEKAGRHGQPQLHAHVIFPNLTTFSEDGRKRYCAAHFKRITKLAATAQRRMNAQLARTLKKAGYQVNLVDGVCRLPGVSRDLCARFSPVSTMLKGPGSNENAAGRRSTKREVRRREDRYLRIRPKKDLLTLRACQYRWFQEVGKVSLEAEKKNYRAARFRKPAELSTSPAEAVSFTPAGADPKPVIAAARLEERRDDVLDDRGSMRPNFSFLGAALRMKLSDKIGYETRNQVIELDYVCTEKAHHLVEHTEALRTLLRLIFPRLIVHQKFTTTERSRFNVTGSAASNPNLVALVTATAAALEVELGQPSVRANWPAVLRWLHSELANRVLEPIAVVRRERAAPRIKPVTPAAEKPMQTNAADPASPPPAPLPPPPVADEPDIDIIP
jgi:conjugative relaxase-like TrwC/TraI family protein